MAQGNSDGQCSVGRLQSGKEIVESVARTVNVPMVEKINQAVNKPPNYINKREVHPVRDRKRFADLANRRPL